MSRARTPHLPTRTWSTRIWARCKVRTRWVENRTQPTFSLAKKVPPVCFHGGREVDEVGASETVAQYKSFISTDELGDDLFKSGTARNAFITAPAGFGNHI